MGRTDGGGRFWPGDPFGISRGDRKARIGNLFTWSASTPGEVVIAQGQVPITLSGDLEDGISNAGLNRGAAVVSHAIQPMSGLEEPDVDLRRVLLDARERG